jgi:acetamidase/formamidase
MAYSARCFAICLWVGLLAHGPLVAAVPAINGTWEITLVTLGVTQNRRLVISGQGADYQATMGDLKLTGRVESGSVRLRCQAEVPCGELTLRGADTSITGEGMLNFAPVTLRGKRSAVRPYAAPRSFDFEPKQYYGLFGSTAAPALTLFPGDTVHTRTIDAEGFDAQGVRVSTLVNPQTGPFYIETAMPGDTLAIHFVKIRTNRATADMYGDALAANALEPYSLRREQKNPKGSSTWTLDTQRGVATLAQPSEKLAHFEVPLLAMLGCVGVAPAFGQSFRTVNLGAYGGNLDYGGVHEGATLYLPVFERGALLFIGDGHARQGDGELTGTGLETSMDVEFTVDLIKDQSLGQPRIEDADFVMISGIGGSLSDALQLATSGMVRWLKETYDLKPGDIAMVLGSSLRYDITELVDPQIHVVAKLSKDALARIAAAKALAPGE